VEKAPIAGKRQKEGECIWAGNSGQRDNFEKFYRGVVIEISKARKGKGRKIRPTP